MSLGSFAERGRGGLAARAAYAALFAVALPALLALWAARLDAVLHLPAYGSPVVGLAVATVGVAAIVAGVIALWAHGDGLPMSPFPPARLVTRGIYRLVPDPIYLGTAMLAVGWSLAVRSGAGLWIVSPVLALAEAAFLLGFERDATRERYGAVAAPLLRLPPAAAARPTGWDRVSVVLLVLLPWLVLYAAVRLLGVPADARSSYVAWEARLPVVPWTEAVYAFAYPFVLLAPLAAGRQSDLRRFALQGLWATATIIPFYLLVPLIAPAKVLPAGNGLWQQLMSGCTISRSPPCPRSTWFGRASPRSFTLRHGRGCAGPPGRSPVRSRSAACPRGCMRSRTWRSASSPMRSSRGGARSGGGCARPRRRWRARGRRRI